MAVARHRPPLTLGPPQRWPPVSASVCRPASPVAMAMISFFCLDERLSQRVVELEEGSKEGSETRSLYTVESPTGSPLHEKLHVSSGPEGRNQYQKLARVEERATDRMKKRNFEGTLPPPVGNQFSVLSDTASMLRASLMGVNIPDDNFNTVDILCELEISRQLLHDNKTSPRDITIKDVLGNAAPLSLTWDDQDMEDDVPFITVCSRRKKEKVP